jgi:hypothetical protein
MHDFAGLCQLLVFVEVLYVPRCPWLLLVSQVDSLYRAVCNALLVALLMFVGLGARRPLSSWSACVLCYDALNYALLLCTMLAWLCIGWNVVKRLPALQMMLCVLR